MLSKLVVNIYYSMTTYQLCQDNVEFCNFRQARDDS